MFLDAPLGFRRQAGQCSVVAVGLAPPAGPSADSLCCSFFEGQWTFQCGGLLAVMTAFPIGAAFALCWCH